MHHACISKVSAIVAAVALIAAGCGSSDDGATSTHISRAEIHAEFGTHAQLHPKVGSRMVIVPDVVGKPQARGARKLHKRGLAVIARFPGRVGNPSLRPECGYTYTHQSPAGGERVPTGSTVLLIQDLCPKYHRAVRPIKP